MLGRIVERKKERLVSAKFKTSISDLRSIIKDSDKPRDFQGAVQRGAGGIRLIAEIKRASPSRGRIRANFDHREIASIYEGKKVDAVSVITEEDFFQGRLEFLPNIKRIVSMPVLRKDFIFSEYQIYEARANGADAILLIAAILGDAQAEDYLQISLGLGMSVLFEIHDIEELGRALKLNVPLVGINNRNLKTLRIDLSTSLELKKEIPADRTVVSESGIKARDDVLKIERAGIDAMLVGTCLMESADIDTKIDQLMGRL